MADISLALNPRDGQIQTVRNITNAVITVDAQGGRTIDGLAEIWITPLSIHNFLYDGTNDAWLTISDSKRPVAVEADVPGLPLVIGTGTSLGVDIVLPAPGIFQVSGLMAFQWTGGNNQDFSGQVEFNTTGFSTVVPFGLGRASTSADWPLTFSFLADNRSGALTGQTIALTASNNGQGVITLDSPAILDWAGPL